MAAPAAPPYSPGLTLRRLVGTAMDAPQNCTMLETDVLVVGGGVAGSMAAIPALEAGLKVVICEKGKVLDHCGSIGCGVDHYLTVMDTGRACDTPAFLLRHVPELTDYIVDMAVARPG